MPLLSSHKVLARGIVLLPLQTFQTKTPISKYYYHSDLKNVLLSSWNEMLS